MDPGSLLCAEGAPVEEDNPSFKAWQGKAIFPFMVRDAAWFKVWDSRGRSSLWQCRDSPTPRG